jgi:hypothetical protein
MGDGDSRDEGTNQELYDWVIAFDPTIRAFAADDREAATYSLFVGEVRLEGKTGILAADGRG